MQRIRIAELTGDDAFGDMTGERFFGVEAADRLDSMLPSLDNEQIGFFHLAEHRDFSEITQPHEALMAWRGGDVAAARDILHSGDLSEASKRFQSLVRAKTAEGVPFVRVQVLDPALLGDGRGYAAYLAFFLSNFNVANGEKVYYLPPESITNMPSLDLGIYNGDVVVLTDYESRGQHGELTGPVYSRTFIEDADAVRVLLQRYYFPLATVLVDREPLEVGMNDIVGALRRRLDPARWMTGTDG